MLSTKTYIEWPQQVNQQAFFWAQLKSVLGKPTLTRERAHSAIRRVSSMGAVSVIELPKEDEKPEIAMTKTAGEAEVIQRNAKLHNQRPIPVAVA